MTVVYIDVLFLLNLVVDYLLLLATARITGEAIARLRFGVSALLGAGYAAILFFPGCGWLSNFFCKICLAVIMVLISFGQSQRLFRLLFVFFCVSAALGGVVLALQLVGTDGITLENGVLYTGFNIRILLVTVILGYVVLSTVFERAALHGGERNDLGKARISINGKENSFTILIDTGNTLKDPTMNLPVMVAEGWVVQSLLTEELDLADPIGTIRRLQDEEIRKRVRLLPYRAIGISNGMLLAIRTDWVEVGERRLKGLLVALSPTPISDGGGYQALIGEI